MKKLTLFFTLVNLLFTSFIFSQNNPGILFSLQQLSDQSWGVFLQPEDDLNPSAKLLTGSGQVTILTPEEFTYYQFRNYSGTWGENARIDSPEEALGRSYISFGLLSDMPKIQVKPESETLLFTFVTDESFSGVLSLFDNENDPFNPPNSISTNPGNDINIADTGLKNGLTYYRYKGNYFTNHTKTKPVFAGQKPSELKADEEGIVIQWLDDNGN
ncbi:MAG: hypothetical protein AAFZ15_27955 [Bacteroidota bacterium]